MTVPPIDESHGVEPNNVWIPVESYSKSTFLLPIPSHALALTFAPVLNHKLTTNKIEPKKVNYIEHNCSQRHPYIIVGKEHLWLWLWLSSMHIFPRSLENRSNKSKLQPEKGGCVRTMLERLIITLSLQFRHKEISQQWQRGCSWKHPEQFMCIEIEVLRLWGSWRKSKERIT